MSQGSATGSETGSATGGATGGATRSNVKLIISQYIVDIGFLNGADDKCHICLNDLAGLKSRFIPNICSCKYNLCTRCWVGLQNRPKKEQNCLLCRKEGLTGSVVSIKYINPQVNALLKLLIYKDKYNSSDYIFALSEILSYANELHTLLNVVFRHVMSEIDFRRKVLVLAIISNYRPTQEWISCISNPEEMFLYLSVRFNLTNVLKHGHQKYTWGNLLNRHFLSTGFFKKFVRLNKIILIDFLNKCDNHTSIFGDSSKSNTLSKFWKVVFNELHIFEYLKKPSSQKYTKNIVAITIAHTFFNSKGGPSQAYLDKHPQCIFHSDMPAIKPDSGLIAGISESVPSPRKKRSNSI